MKPKRLLTFIFIVILPSISLAQVLPDSIIPVRKNIRPNNIGLTIYGYMSRTYQLDKPNSLFLSYERAVSKRFSLATHLQIGYEKHTYPYNQSTYFNGNFSTITKSSDYNIIVQRYGVRPELRYYLKGDRNLNGFFNSGFYCYTSPIFFFSRSISSEPTLKPGIDKTVYHLYNYGISVGFGFQKVLPFGLLFDGSIGVGYIRSKATTNLPIKYNSESLPLKDSYYFQFRVGYAF